MVTRSKPIAGFLAILLSTATAASAAAALIMVKALLAHPNQRIDHSSMFFRYIDIPPRARSL